MVVLIAAIAVARTASGPSGTSDASPVASRAATPGASPATGGPPPCRFGDREALDDSYEDWRSTILDTTFRLPRSYVPPDLVSVEKAGFPGPQTARSFVMADLRRLREAAEQAGHPIGIIWGYRSFSTQVSVFEHSVAVNGSQHAVSHAARPGHSEHQLGTVFDFKTEGAADVDRTWESQPAGRWMAENAWRYGFVMSYPRGREDETCYGYEPWHYRYFGPPLAAAIHGSGETTRRYLWTHRTGA
jgi:D-alanyl-D-alanine carboxypeptidase